MAFRIHNNVIRGEIDNRTKGLVRGTIWIEGRAEPITLDLEGNTHPDLAGCLLTFKNPGLCVTHPNLESLATGQRGTVGDMTAARKEHVFDVPFEEAYSILNQNKIPPEHIANVLYLEWFSQSNGRVVIESTDYNLTISAHEWQLTPEEDAQRAADVTQAMIEFLKKLTDSIEQHKRDQKDYEEPWNEHDYERFLKESDARADKYGELLDKFGHSDEAEEKIADAMGWNQELADEESEEREKWIEEMNRACEEALNEPEPEPDPHRKGIDWVRTEDGDLRHPLQHACFENAMNLWHEVKALGLSENPDNDLTTLVSEFQIAGAKLAGALNGVARGEGFHDNAFTVACLKRALDHLHKAQAGLEAVAPRKLLPNDLITETRRQLFAIRERVLEQMERFRRGSLG